MFRCYNNLEEAPEVFCGFFWGRKEITVDGRVCVEGWHSEREPEKQRDDGQKREGDIS